MPLKAGGDAGAGVGGVQKHVTCVMALARCVNQAAGPRPTVAGATATIIQMAKSILAAQYGVVAVVELGHRRRSYTKNMVLRIPHNAGSI